MKAEISCDAISINVPTQGQLRISLKAEDENEVSLLSYLSADANTAIKSSEAGLDYEDVFVIIPSAKPQRKAEMR